MTSLQLLSNKHSQIDHTPKRDETFEITMDEHKNYIDTNLVLSDSCPSPVDKRKLNKIFNIKNAVNNSEK